MNAQQSFLTIQNAAKFLKASEKTLRRWEARGILVPVRTSGGHRRYTLTQLESFKKNRKSLIAATKPASTTQIVAPQPIIEAPVKEVREVVIPQALPTRIAFEPKEETYVKPVIVEEVKPASNNNRIVFADNTSSEKAETYAVLSEIYKKTPHAHRFVVRTYAKVFAVLLFIVTFGFILKSVGSYVNTGVSQYLGNMITAGDQAQVAGNTDANSEELASVLAATSFSNANFRVNVESTFNEDVAINAENVTSTSSTLSLFNTSVATLQIGGAATTITVGATTGTTTINNSLDVNGTTNDIAGVLNLSGNTLTSTGDLAINPAGGGVSIGTGTAGDVDLAGGDFFVSGDIEVNGTAFLPTLSINGDTFTDLTGTGLSVSGGTLQTTIGTSIESSEIADATISEVDLNASNDGTNGYALTYNSSTGGFTWTDMSAALSGAGWTDGGTVVALTTGTDNVTIGSTTQFGKLGIDGDTDEIQLLVQGNSTQTNNLAVFENSAGTDLVTIDNSGNLTLAGSLTINSQTFTDLTGNGLTVSSNALTIALPSATDGLSSTTSNGSGLEVLSSGLTLLQGCSTGQVLKWNETNDSWECANDSGATSAIINVESNDVAVGTDVDTIDFTTDFSLSASPTNEANIAIADDILDFTEFQDTLDLDASTEFNLGANALTFDLDGTGDFSIADAGTAFATFSDIGGITFDPTTTADITFTTDGASGSNFTITGLASGTGSALCLDGSNNLVTCTTGAGGLAGSGTAGQIAFFDTGSSVTSEASGFSWDATNNRLGIGTDSPTSKLHVTGAVIGKALAIFNETGDQNILEASASGVPVLSVARSGSLIFEGSTDDTNETTLAVSDPSADRTITLPDLSGTIIVSGHTFTGDVTATLDSDNSTALTIAADSVALGTDTTGNYVATITGNTQVGVSGSGSENAGVTLSINNNSIDTAQLASTLTFSDGDLVDLSSINNSSTSEGLKLPQASSCASGTAEGQICWDTDNDLLVVGNGSSTTNILTNATTLFTLAGTSGSSQTILSGDTVTIAAGTGITTTAGATDTVTIASTLGTDITNSEIVADTIDWDAISDSMTLDANTSITAGSALSLTIGNNVTLTTSGTGSIVATDLVCTDCVALATETTGNYVATVTGSSHISVSGSGSENAGISLSIAADSLDFTELSDTLALDANTSITQDGSETLTFSNTGSGVTAFDLTSTGDFEIRDGGTAFATFSDAGGITFDPTTTADITFTTDGASGSNFSITGLASGTGSALCLDGSNNIVTCTAGSGAITGTGTSGQIAFFNGSGSITSETSGFAWDATNNKLGLGTDSPTGVLTVSSTAIGKALAIFNDTGTDQNIITASASGTTVANLDRSGNLAIEGALSDLTGGTLTINDDLAISGGNITTAFTADSTVTVTGTLTANGTFDSNGDVTIADTDIAFDGASTTFTTTGAFTLTPGGAVLLGDGGDTMQINTSDWDISTTGDMTGFSFDANGTGNSITNIESADILDNTLTASDLSATLAFADGDILNLSGITQSNATNEGFVLPTLANTANLPASGVGYLAYDTALNKVRVYNGSSWADISGSTSSFTLSGDTGTDQTIADGNTLEVTGGTGITTAASATDIITLNFASTELNDLTFGDNTDASILWTFNQSGATDPTLTFANDAITLTAATTTLSGDLAINGGNITTATTFDQTLEVTGITTLTGNLNANGGLDVDDVFVVADGGAVTANTDFDFVFAASENAVLTNTSASADQLSLAVSGVTTDAIDALSLAFTQADDLDATDSNAAQRIALTSSSADADSLYGIYFDDFTGGVNPIETAVRFGTGFNNIFEFEGNTADTFETLVQLAEPTTDQTITIPNDTGTICLSSGNCAGGAGGSKWTDSGTLTYLTGTTDSVTIGSSTELGKLAVDGDADEIQLLVQGNATQTSNLGVFETSAGADLLTVDVSGNLAIEGALSDISGTSLSINDDVLVQGGDLTLGQNGTSGTLTLYNELGATDRTTVFQNSASQTQDITYTLPVDDGTSNYVLTTNGSGVLSWVDVTAGTGAGDITAVGDITSNAAFTQTAGADGTTLYFEGSTSDSNEIALTSADPGADITVTIPNIAGTLASLAGTQTFTGAKTFSAATVFDGTVTANTDFDLVLASAENFTITTTTPTVDAIVGSLGTSTTDGVDGLQLTFGVSAASGNLIDLTPSYADATAGATSETFNIIDIDAFTATQNAAGDTGLIRGLNIGNLTQTETAGTLTASALRIGTGWDDVLNYNGTTVINSTGQVVSTQVTGTLFSTNTDTASANTIIQGDTLAINGDSNGIDVTHSGDTMTVAFDGTEVGAETWGTGTGFTWTFDTGATDPTIAFGSDSITFSVAAVTGTLTANGILDANGQLTLGDGGDTGAIDTSDWDITATGDMTGIGAITADGVITFSGLTSDTDDTVVIQNASNQLRTREIDTRVWGSTLVDANGTAGHVAFFSDANTLTNNADFYWNNTDEKLGIGTNGSPVAKLDVNGAVIGKALAIFNETGDQNIIEASASGVSVLSIARNGNLIFEGTDNAHETTIAVTDPTTDRTITLPDLSGTVILSGHTFTGDVTATLGASNTTALTIAADAVALGTDTTGNYVATITGNTQIGVVGSGSETAGVTLSINADSVDFTELSDTLALDANTSITQDGSETFTITNAGTGVTDINLSSTGDFEIRDGGTAFATFSDAGGITFDPTTTADITFTTDGASGSNLSITGLASGTGSALCVDGSSNVVTCTVGSGGVSGSGTAGQIAFFDSANSITSEAAGFGWDTTNNLFTLAGVAGQTTQTNQVITSAAQGLTSGGLFSASETATSATASFTGDIGSFSSNRDNDTAAQTLTDTGNLVDLSRITTTNNASAVTNVTGALLNVSNTVTAITGTIADSANLISVTQDAEATGALLYLNANRTGNSNTLLFEQSAGGTDILSLQDDGDLAILGDLTITGGNITNAITLDSTLAVTGITTLTGNLNANGGLDVDDAFVIADGGVLTTSAAANFNGGLDIDDVFVVADGGAVTANTDVDLVLASAENFTITTTTPTADAIVGSLGTSTTDGVDGLQLTYGVSAASGNLIDLTPSYADATAGTTSEEFNIIDIDAFIATQNAAGDTGLIRGINIGNLTQTETAGTITANALNIGTGWDDILTYNGTTVIDGDGTVIAGQITGTLFNTDTDTASANAIARGDTLSIVGNATDGLDGIDVTHSGDTITIAFDGTEITDDTFGAGSGFTWTFDAGATDPTIAFGSDAVTVTAASTTFSGDITVTGGTINGAAGEAIDLGVATSDVLTFTTGGATEALLSGTNFTAGTSEGNSLGSATVEWEQLFLGDDNGIAFGLDQDWTFGYDEATDDRLELVTAGTSGMLLQTATATGNAYNIVSNSLSTGSALEVSSTSTSVGTITDGALAYFNWAPGSATTATGDLFRINIGSNGNVTNLFNITDNGSTVFSVSENQITSAAPHQFTAAGDVSIAYDLQFTNQTASYIKSLGPITLQAGELSESNYLTLQTYNAGRIINDQTTTGGTTISSAIGSVTPQSLFQVDGAHIGKALVTLNETGDQNILTASASGTTVANLERDGDFNADGVLSFGDSTPDGNAYNTIGTGDAGGADIGAALDLYITDALEVDGTAYLDGAATVTGTLTANGILDANGVVTLGDGGDAVTIDSNALILQTTGAGSDITLNAVDQIILTDFTTCTALETVAGVLTCGTDDGGTMSSFTLTGTDTGTNQTITNGETLTIAAGTGIDTTPSNTDTLTVALDTTEINDTTFGDNSDVSMVWTFNQSGATDPTLTFANDAITLTAATTTLSGDLAINGGNITTATTFDQTLAVTGITTLTGNLNANGGMDVDDVFVVADGGAVTANTDFDLVLASAENFTITSTTPTADAIVGSLGTSTTDNVDGVALTFGVSAASGDLIHLTPSYADATAGTTSETFNVINIDGFTATQNAAGDTGLINGVNIGALTQTETAGTLTAYALQIGAGWDRAISASGTIAFTSLNCTGNTNGGAITADASGILSCSDDDGGGTTTTLQTAYSNDVDGGNTTISLLAADDSVVVSNPSTLGTDSSFVFHVEQLNTGAIDALVLSESGTGQDITTGTANQDLDISANGTGNIVMNADADTVLSVAGTAALTEDLVSLSSSGATVTDAIDGLSIAFTQGDDADATDTNAGINLSITGDSVDADTLIGFNIANLAGASAGATSRALQIGSAWDANMFFNDTSTQIQIADTGVFTWENASGTDFLTLSVTAANLTGDLTIQGGDIIGANSASIDLGEVTTGALTFVAGTTGDFVFTVDADTDIRTIGGTDGTDALVIPAGDILLSDGDFDLSGGDFNVTLDAGDGVNIAKGAAATVDVATINGGTSATDGVDNLQLTFGVSNASGNVIDITPSYSDTAAVTTSEEYNIIDIDAFTATQNAAGDTGLIRGLNIGNLTQTETAGTVTASALRIGTGWDDVLNYNGTTVINSTGQVVSTQVTGTLFSTNTDTASANTIVQGDTLLINGDANGIDVTHSGDTMTVAFDGTEVGAETWGTGTGFTWTFDTGATDPTIAFADNAVNITAGTTTLTGALSVTGNTTLGDASGDTVVANADAWTFANDTDFTLSGGLNGLSFDGTTFSVDAASNKIGIGIAAPTGKLHLVDTGSLEMIINADSDNTTETDIPVLTFRSDGATNRLDIGVEGTDGQSFTNSLANSAFLEAKDAQVLQFATNNTAQMTIDTAGDVGIGTTTPDGKLHVNGGAIGKALAIFNETGDQNIISASASGTTVFNLERDGDLHADGAFSFGDSTPDGNAYNTIGTGDAGGADIGAALDLYITDALEVDGTTYLDGALDSNGNVNIADTDIAFDGATTTFTTTGAFTLTPGGAVTLGDGGDTLAINSSDWDIDATGAITGVSFDANGTGNSISNIESADVLDNTLTASDLNATLTFADGDFLDLSAINNNAASEGFKLPQNLAANFVSPGSAGFIAYDTTGNKPMYFNGTSWTDFSGSTSSFTLSGDTGTDQTISDSNTLEVTGGVGIDTAAGATDTMTLTFDSTELNDLTFGDNSDASILWTFNQSGVTDPTIAFSNDTIALTAGSTTFSGDITVTGNDITFGNGESISNGSNGIINMTTDDLKITSLTPRLVFSETDNVDWQYTVGGDQFIVQRNGLDRFVMNSSGDVIFKGTSFVNNEDATVNMGASAVSSTLQLQAGGSNEVALTTTNFAPTAAEGNTLGSSTAEWEQLFLGDDNGISFGLDQDWTLAYDEASSDRLELATTTANQGFFFENSGSGTRTGDLFAINIGASLSVTGDLFVIQDNGTDLFGVSETQITSALPHQFTAAGDVSIAYDLQFTNQTASFVKSDGPLTVESGESFENNDLTLKTYGTGNIVANLGTSGNFLPGTDNVHDLGSSSFRWTDIHATNSTIQTSDSRLKENINNIAYGIDTLMSLRPVSYTWIDNPNQGTKLGFIAQEMLSTIPEVVNVGDDENQTLGIRYTDLIPVIIKSIQDQQAEIAEAKNLALGAMNENGEINLNEIQTSSISTSESNENIAINIGNDQSTSSFGKLLINNANGDEVASFDEQGNATIAGTFASDSIDTNNLTAETASVSGELTANIIRADQIISPDLMTREDIEAMLNESLSNQENLESNNWDTSATGSASLNELALENLFVTGTAAIDTLSVTNSFTVGNDLVISNNAETGITSMDTLNAPLSLQSSASQPILLMAGLVQIDTNGNVAIAGNLDVEGKIASSGISVQESMADAISGFGKIISVQDISGNDVAVISASGAAEFKSVTTDVLAVRADQEATSSATLAGTVFSSNASAGSAAIGEGTRQVTIQNSKVNQDTLIFVTATSESDQPIFVKEKSDGEFIVGFTNPATTDATFNWWIVEVQ